MISSTQYDTGYCMLYDTYCYDTVLVYSTVLHLQYVYCILYSTLCGTVSYHYSVDHTTA